MEKAVFSVCDFGAVPNSNENQSKNIQTAIDTCFKSGGGEVVIPAGDYSVGDIRLRSGVYIHLLGNAHLIGTGNPNDYFNYRYDKLEPLDSRYVTDDLWQSPKTPNRSYSFMRTAGSRWNNGIIRGIFAENCGVIGEKGSYIDGSNCYDEDNEEQYRGPHGISLWYCKNVMLKGYTVQNSGNWAHAMHYCENITADSITVLAGHDGIHPTCCKNVIITNSSFYTGDDCIAGFGNLNIYVGNCILNSACSALRLGATNALIEKCRIYGPCKYYFRGSLTKEEKISGKPPKSDGKRNNMLSVFTYYSDFAFPVEYQPGNIVVSDCSIDFADRLLHYNFSGNETWQKNRPLSSFAFKNITATNISMPLTCYGDESGKINLEISDSVISFREGYENVTFMHANNYEKIHLKNLEIKNNISEPFILSWQTKDAIEFENVTSEPHKNKLTVYLTDKPFECESI